MIKNDKNKMINISDNAIEELQRIRQHIHQHPELGFDVYNTAEYITKELEKIGLKVQKSIGKTGLVCNSLDLI